MPGFAPADSRMQIKHPIPLPRNEEKHTRPPCARSVTLPECVSGEQHGIEIFSTMISNINCHIIPHYYCLVVKRLSIAYSQVIHVLFEK